MSGAPHRLPTEDTVGLIEEGDVVLWEANVPGEAAGLRRLKKLTALSLGAAALLAVTIGAAVSAGQAAVPQEADVGSSVGLVGGMALASTFANGLAAAAKLMQDAQTSEKDIKDSLSNMEAPAFEVQKQLLAEKPPKNVTEGLKHLQGDALFKKLDEDGNNCPDDEEELAGLCYGKCSAITKGEYPIRTTAFACCRERPCSIFNTKFTSVFKLCKGNDVAGKREGGECPHTPGDCLRNEELLFGECYMKCAILTDNQYTFRVGPQSCCKYQTKIACLDPANTASGANYSVGGGVNDPTYNVSFGEAHTPLPDLAQVLATTTLPTLPPIPEMPEMPEMPTMAPMPAMPTLAPMPAMPTMAPLPEMPSLPALNGCEAQTDEEKCSEYKPSDSLCFCSWTGVSCMMACA